jgi:hypothetical protein
MIGIVFETTLVEAADQVRIVGAISQQVELHFAPAWNRLPSHPRLYPSMAAVPEGLPVIRVVDVVDDPDALGYHTEERDHVTGIVGAKTILDAGGSVMKGADSISACLSHEVLEASLNPFVGMWSDGPTGHDEYAFEACDPTQDRAYEIDGVAVSDFVYPRWFDSQAKGGQFDHLWALRAPFTRTRGGYIVLRDASRTTRQLGERPVWKAGSIRGAKLGITVVDADAT